MTNDERSSAAATTTAETEGFIPTWMRHVIIGRNPRRTLLRIFVLVVTTYVVIKYVLLPVRVTGTSMLPTYRDGGLNFANRFAYLWHEPRRGDVVSIRLAGERAMLMKRIIGLPGETVAFVQGHVLIDGEPLAEPYVKLPCLWEHGPVTLRSNEYFCVGDNRSMHKEYHTFGVGTRDRIIGKMVL